MRDTDKRRKKKTMIPLSQLSVVCLANVGCVGLCASLLLMSGLLSVVLDDFIVRGNFLTDKINYALLVIFRIDAIKVFFGSIFLFPNCTKKCRFSFSV